MLKESFGPCGQSHNPTLSLTLCFFPLNYLHGSLFNVAMNPLYPIITCCIIYCFLTSSPSICQLICDLSCQDSHCSRLCQESQLKLEDPWFIDLFTHLPPKTVNCAFILFSESDCCLLYTRDLNTTINVVLSVLYNLRHVEFETLWHTAFWITLNWIIPIFCSILVTTIKMDRVIFILASANYLPLYMLVCQI